MLERELDGYVVCPSPQQPVHIKELLNTLFPPKAFPVSIEKIHNTLRRRAQKQYPGLTNENWWRKWLLKLAVPDREELIPDNEDVPGGYWDSDEEDGEDEDEKVEEKGKVKKPSREDKLARFFQGVCNKISTAFPQLKGCSRQWTSYFHNRPLGNEVSNMKRKPDVVSLKSYIPVEDWRRKGKRVSWKLVEIIVEDKKRRLTGTQFLKEVAVDHYNKAYCLFENQENRHFVLAFTLTGDLGRISVMDRSGVIHSSAFNIHKEPKIFLHALIGMTFAPDVYIGFDPTIIVQPLGTQTIEIGNRVYTLTSSVWRNAMIMGRATACWLAMCDGEEFLIKEVWVLEDGKPSEIYFLREAAGIAGVPQLVDWEDVIVNMRLDTTDNNRGVFEPLLNRVHRRLVFKLPGIPIFQFANRRELLSAYIDCLTCHKDLHVKAKILHCDISLHNLMIERLSRWGLLIDYDYANDQDESRQTSKPYPSTPYIWPCIAKEEVEMEDEEEEEKEKEGRGERVKGEGKGNTPGMLLQEAPDSKTLEQPLSAEEVNLQKTIAKRFKTLRKTMVKMRGQRTGTHPFMAGEILINPKTKHLPRHDLESFLYVFIFKCCMCLGPNNYMKTERSAPPFLYIWLHPEIQPNEEVLGSSKLGLLSATLELFRMQVTDHFTVYMSVFKGLVESIKEMFKNREQIEVTHDKIIAEMQKTLALLPLEEDLSKPKASRDSPKPSEAACDRQRRQLSARVMQTKLRRPKVYVSADPNVMLSKEFESFHDISFNSQINLWVTDSTKTAEDGDTVIGEEEASLPNVAKQTNVDIGGPDQFTEKTDNNSSTSTSENYAQFSSKYSSSNITRSMDKRVANETATSTQKVTKTTEEKTTTNISLSDNTSSAIETSKQIHPSAMASVRKTTIYNRTLKSVSFETSNMTTTVTNSTFSKGADLNENSNVPSKTSIPVIAKKGVSRPAVSKPPVNMSAENAPVDESGIGNSKQNSAAIAHPSEKPSRIPSILPKSRSLSVLARRDTDVQANNEKRTVSGSLDSKPSRDVLRK